MTKEQIKELLDRMEAEKLKTKEYPRNPAQALQNVIRKAKGAKISGCMCSQKVREEIYLTAKEIYESKEE